MSLPPELIDEIIRYHASDVRSLRSCSLVARSWTYPSRRWLFEEVLISRKNLQRWLDRISARNVELLCNVRAFTYVYDKTVWNGITPYRIDTLYRYLSSFHRLKRLGLTSMFLGPEVPQQIGLFSPFQHSLSSLTLLGCHVTSSAFVTLINYFPLLVYLSLQSLTYEANGEHIPQLSRPLRGILAITDCRTQDQALFNKLSNPPPELEELTLSGVHMPIFYDCIVRAHGGSVRRLIMSGATRRHWSEEPFPTLSHCRGLRELVVQKLTPLEDELTLIESITSTNLQKIVLPARHGITIKGDLASARYYEEVDDSLCILVERLRELGYKNRLDVVFCIEEVPDDDEMGFREFLPRFRERGRVILLWGKSERVVYCSDS